MTDASPKEKSNQLAKFFKDELLKITNKKIYKSKLFHYTNLETLFNMLESDSLWLSGLRFTNDSSEETILGNEWLFEHNYHGDNFIFCVCDEPDVLSQWRGYCFKGGVSVGFDIAITKNYSVLYADYETSRKHRKHIDKDGIAVPVIYIQNNVSKNTPQWDYDFVRNEARMVYYNIEKTLKEKNEYSLLSANDFVPYIKHFSFREENERRLLLSNSNDELTKCIRFRNLLNGTKIPYIVVKNGCLDESHEYFVNTAETNIKQIVIKRPDMGKIILENCSNQSELCSAVRRFIRKNKDMDETINGGLKVFCDGHLPVRSIMVAPMVDQKRVREQIYRFCQSKYWLKDVNVSTSSIPYVPSINNL